MNEWQVCTSHMTSQTEEGDSVWKICCTTMQLNLCTAVKLAEQSFSRTEVHYKVLCVWISEFWNAGAPEPAPSHLLLLRLRRSISLALKWCRRSEWIRLDSVPFSSLTRDCGALLGLGMAQYWRPGGWSLARGPAALSLALSSVGLHLLHRLVLPSQPQGLFYCLFFLKFLLVPQLVMTLAPGLVQLFTPRKWKEQ